MIKSSDKQAYRDWESYYLQFIQDVDVDSTESEFDKIKRIKKT